MKKTLKIFVIPRERVPAGPPNPPIEEEIEAASMDALHRVVHQKLVSDGYSVRAISFTQTGLIAYVEETT